MRPTPTAANLEEPRPAGMQFRHAGIHLIVDLWGARNLDCPERARQALIETAAAMRATLLEVNIHDFGDELGVTGVALLAESHISIHSWPEHGYAAVDLFTCGSSDPYEGLGVLQKAFDPERMQVVEHKRGFRIMNRG
jgi:S-adenosylmethionine decarboxylase